MDKQSGYTWKLGMFVTIGLLLFIMAIYFIGKQKNLFGSTFNITSQFKTVSGLEVGNNVRFSGINIGTVEEIRLINDSSVVVSMVIKDEVREFIKTDARASIGSDGLMGDKVLTISPGVKSQKVIENGGAIASVNGIEMQDLMKSVKKSVDNAAVITDELAIFSHSMNNGNGALARLVRDDKMASSVSNTLSNLESGTKGFSENMEAAKSNFLLKGYFKKKEKEKEKKKEEQQEKAEKAKEEKEKQAKQKEEDAKKAKEEKEKADKEKAEKAKEEKEKQAKQKEEDAKKAQSEKGKQ
ncbi:phospholipid/cholesterol/gamma-HCH transport system substrate-binding protein [Flavobacterium araucananum]|jgi:phospholipid/cholesterol/gamma-HCH transport system substrate-binding protein|uniref:Organic solvent ABC transporter substrate-binding protein n=1 Tax=Flavobacterium araucananum TaxID=946678 RepID=A0A227NNM6_9FLAO|nr:MlaD family protein [Flavobacterium araucananum]OXE98936.1 organic solvent ABC transporter substrate-binding protein [Flavobacterium araucananum]PWJ99942.1 phospholipid/cholesterol/gamma-HCH transport system substrate-binding protein [Flavobacterium araucananum]